MPRGCDNINSATRKQPRNKQHLKKDGARTKSNLPHLCVSNLPNSSLIMCNFLIYRKNPFSCLIICYSMLYCLRACGIIFRIKHSIDNRAEEFICSVEVKKKGVILVCSVFNAFF